MSSDATGSGSGGTEGTVSLQDVMQENQDLEDTANAVLGDSDDSKCSYPKGYVSRQALYACGTCIGEDEEEGGVCLACSLHCHEGHNLYELYTKRFFRCDCGNSKFHGVKCTLNPEKDLENSSNKYNHNFKGLYCNCNRPYPDSEDEVEDEMIQCIICEDWFHSRHLQNETPSSYEEMACDLCMESHDFLFSYKLHTTPTKIENALPNSTSHETEKVNVTEPISSTKNGNEDASSTKNGNEDASSTENGNEDASTTENGNDFCELARRKAVQSTSDSATSSRGAGFFDKNWRSMLCRCSSCEELYGLHHCLFLLDQSDSLPAYERRAPPIQSSHDEAVEALCSMGRVQQVEAIHQFNNLKSELSDFLKDFAQNKKVVSKRDIDGFFEEMQQRKRQRLETGNGVPPANCHY